MLWYNQCIALFLFILFADKKVPSGGKIYICIHVIVGQFCFYFKSGITYCLDSNQATTVQINMMFSFSGDFDLSDAFGPGKN